MKKLVIPIILMLLISSFGLATGLESREIIIDRDITPDEYQYYDYNNDGVLDMVRGESMEPYAGFSTITQKSKDLKSSSDVHIAYDRFDVYINGDYYVNNTPEIDAFFDEFEERYAVLESLTGWSAEEFYNQKLHIDVSVSAGCYGGGGGNGYVILRFSDPLYMNGCQSAYRDDGTWYFGNPGELGDDWRYMGVAIHETTHAISPKPVFKRLWLAEGWGRYNEFNILEIYEDINKETADYYIHQGGSYYNWEGYVANDYHDTSPDTNEIQESAGYSITAWMLSMLRDDYGMDWNNFYYTLNNNMETLEKAWELGGYGYSSYYTDSYMINVFEHVTGTDMYPVFRYDGPDGPGWGVRNWETLEWYADLTPELAFSNETPAGGDMVDLLTTIYNNGDTSLIGVSVRVYNGDELLDEQFVDVPAHDSTIITTPFSQGAGTYTITAKSDEDGIKIESDETNNEDSKDLIFSGSWICGDANGQEGVDIDDVMYLVSYIFQGGPEPAPYESGDVNMDGFIDIDDVVYLVNYIFQGGTEPCNYI